MKDLPLKAIIEQVSYNVLDFLTRQDMWSVAYQVLVRFEGTLDSFVRSRVSSACNNYYVLKSVFN